MEKVCRARRATDDNMAVEHCMLDTQGYRHTLIICNTYCFSTATMVTRTRLSVNYTYIACRINFGIGGKCFQKLSFVVGRSPKGKVYAYILNALSEFQILKCYRYLFEKWFSCVGQT